MTTHDTVYSGFSGPISIVTETHDWTKVYSLLDEYATRFEVGYIVEVSSDHMLFFVHMVLHESKMEEMNFRMNLQANFDEPDAIEYQPLVDHDEDMLINNDDELSQAGLLGVIYESGHITFRFPKEG